MVKQYEDTSIGSSEVKKIVSDEVKPLLEKLTEIVDKLDRYHKHDIEFQQKFLLLVSQMFRNQQISMEAYDQLDSFIEERSLLGNTKPAKRVIFGLA